MRGRRNLWLLLIVLLCACSLWFGRDHLPVRPPSSTAGSPATRLSALPEGDRDVAVGQPHFLVLNGTGRSGLARDFGLWLTQAGWVCERIGNAPPPAHTHTLLINRRLPVAVARRLASDLGGVRLLLEWNERGTEDVVLVLGADWKRVADRLRSRSATAP